MLITFDFQDCFIRMERRANGHIWVCLTDMAKATNKKVNDWARLKDTPVFLKAIESVTGFPVTETIQGGISERQGTWAVQEVALEFAGWCSLEFKLWMLRQIKRLMNEGQVSLKEDGVNSQKALLDVVNLVAKLSDKIDANDKLIQQSLEALSIQEEKNIENEYYLKNLAEITIEHSFIKKFFEIAMLIKMSGYLFPEINYTIKNLLTIFSVDFPVRDIAFYSSHFYRLDNKGKNPHKQSGSTGSYVYSGKDLIYPVVAIGILSSLSWENLRDSIEIDYKLRFPQSNRPFLPHN